MTKVQKLTIEQSELREATSELLSKVDSLSDDERKQLDKNTKRLTELEPELRAAILLDETETTTDEPDAEQRERIELREKCKVSKYFDAALRGRMPDGPEAELQAAADVEGVPLELWENNEVEQRDISSAPTSGQGVRLDPILPAIFAPSVAKKLMIDMPRMRSGTYSTGTIGTSLTAGSRAKQGGVPQTVAAITTQTASPKRIGGSLGLTIEDIAEIGTANFEPILKDNLSLVISDELDDQMLNGAGAGNDLTGIFERLTDAADPEAAVETWERFIAIQASAIDGLWAETLGDIAIVVNPKTYRLAASTVRSGNAGNQTALEHLSRMGDSFYTNKRMPDEDTNISRGIVCRKGRKNMRLAVCPHWGSISVDDIFTGSLKGERYFTISVLVGDVILTQPSAYSEIAFRTSV